MNTNFEQKDHGFLTYPTSPWHIALFKWPVYLWRLGLGPIIGRIFILFTHIGRKSGLPRRTMTERYYLNGRNYAPSGFGRRPQWWRNIEVNPLVTIQTTDGVQSARAVRVTGISDPPASSSLQE